MSRKTLRKLILGGLLIASCASFAYINFTEIDYSPNASIGNIDIQEQIPETPTVVTPDAAIIRKAIVIAKCFLYPGE